MEFITHKHTHMKSFSRNGDNYKKVVKSSLNLKA
jgi:hypothetical protein